MGRCDESGKRVKWTRAEKKMVKEMREVGLQPIKPVLTLRSKAERYGKQPIDPAIKSQNLPPHLQSRRTPRVRSVIVIPDAAGAVPSSPPVPHDSEPTMQIQMAAEFPDVSPNFDDSVTQRINEEVCAEAFAVPPETVDNTKRMIYEEDEMELDNASEVHETALIKYVQDEQTFSEDFITDKWEDWIPQFFPLYEGPSLPLADLPTNILMGIREKLPPKEQAKFLTTDQSVAWRPEVKEILFQLKKVQRSLFNLMGEWAYYIRWIQPREIARTIPIRQDRLDLAYRHYVRFNWDMRAEKMSINAIARVWGVYRTELRELIDWQKGGDDDSSDDDIMQQ